MFHLGVCRCDDDGDVAEFAGILPGNGAQRFRECAGHAPGVEECDAPRAAPGFVIAQRPAGGGEKILDLGRQHAIVLTWFGKQHKSLLYSSSDGT